MFGWASRIATRGTQDRIPLRDSKQTFLTHLDETLAKLPKLRAFAAPRNGDLWSEVRPQIAADAARRGGTATEQDGPFGTELFCEVQVKNADGKVGNQVSRVIGFNGPRWLLRATFLGRPARDPEALADGILALKQDPALAASLGAALAVGALTSTALAQGGGAAGRGAEPRDLSWRR